MKWKRGRTNKFGGGGSSNKLSNSSSNNNNSYLNTSALALSGDQQYGQQTMSKKQHATKQQGDCMNYGMGKQDSDEYESSENGDDDEDDDEEDDDEDEEDSDEDELIK